MEEEGVFAVFDMLKHDLHGYKMIVGRFRELIHQAQQCGDFGTELLLKEQLQILEIDAHGLHHILADNTSAFEHK